MHLLAAELRCPYVTQDNNSHPHNSAHLYITITRLLLGAIHNNPHPVDKLPKVDHPVVTHNNMVDTHNNMVAKAPQAADTHNSSRHHKATPLVQAAVALLPCVVVHLLQDTVARLHSNRCPWAAASHLPLADFELCQW
jgi:hypothetical protein